jgi:hypothetical protein
MTLEMSKLLTAGTKNGLMEKAIKFSLKESLEDYQKSLGDLYKNEAKKRHNEFFQFQLKYEKTEDIPSSKPSLFEKNE